MQQTSTPQAVEDCHNFLLWLIRRINQFPRNQRFTLGDRLEKRAIIILENLVEASYSRNKKQILYRVNKDIEICRHLWRLSKELHLISIKQYEHGSRLLLQLGSQIGGWIKYV